MSVMLLTSLVAVAGPSTEAPALHERTAPAPSASEPCPDPGPYVSPRIQRDVVAVVGAAEERPAASAPRLDAAPFVSPRIIRDLVPWLSDQERGEQVVAIDLVGSQGSNRYFGAFEVKPGVGPHPEVVFEDKEADATRVPFFGYHFVGVTRSGVQVLWIRYGTGGTGIFESLLLVRIEREKALSYDGCRRLLRLDRERVVLRRLGEVPLGDRYIGEVIVRGDDIVIGADGRKGGEPLWKAGATLRVELLATSGRSDGKRAFGHAPAP